MFDVAPHLRPRRGYGVETRRRGYGAGPDAGAGQGVQA